MIRIKLLPDGLTEIPDEARDHSVLASKLEAADPPDKSPAPSWRDIEREVPGSKDHLVLRIPDATLDDYASGALDGFANAVANINGLKKHPDGWTETEE